MRLLIISNMSHYLVDDQIFGWGPTVEEINHLSTIFEEILHVGCLHLQSAPASALPYNNDNITFIPLPPAGGQSIKAKLEIIWFSPLYIKTIWQALDKTDAVHLRCPANIPLIALILLIIRKKPLIRWVKYAGNWGAGSDYPFSYRLQRWILKHFLAKCVVTVNGQWEDQKKHIVTFNNPCLSQHDLLEANKVSKTKTLTKPINLIFLGALNERKGVGRLLQIANELSKIGTLYKLDVLGDGPKREEYEKLCRKHGLEAQVLFHGWVPKPDLKYFYNAAHINILPSESEGWPKVLSEGMAYGVVPIAGAVSSIPQILAQTQAGVSTDPHDINGFVVEIKRMIHEPKIWKKYHTNSLKAASMFTYENYLHAVNDLFIKAWDIHLKD